MDAALQFFHEARRRGGDGVEGAPLNPMIYGGAMYACVRVRAWVMVMVMAWTCGACGGRIVSLALTA